MKRFYRYGDIEFENSGLDLGKIGKKSTSFFVGKGVDKRMDEMREAILYVRKNWGDKKLKENAVKNFESLYKIKLVDKEWCDAQGFKKENSNYELVKFYTTDKGYDEFFKRMNGDLRNLDSANIERTLGSPDHVTETAFLVEYMNVELYNYIHEKEDSANFEGCVYRGMKVKKEVIDDLFHVKDLPVDERKISVPMSFMSTSKDIDVAKEFLKDGGREDASFGEKENLIMKIHVANLSQEYLSFYHSLFPNSVVSSLCAVPIKDLSEYTKENEVLMRGAFFQVLNFYKDESIIAREKPCHILEVFMMNSNRDHLTTSQFEGTNARAIFNALVSIDKFKKSREYLLDESERALYFDEERKNWAKLLELEKAEKEIRRSK